MAEGTPRSRTRPNWPSLDWPSGAASCPAPDCKNRLSKACFVHEIYVPSFYNGACSLTPRRRSGKQTLQQCCCRTKRRPLSFLISAVVCCTRVARTTADLKGGPSLCSGQHAHPHAPLVLVETLRHRDADAHGWTSSTARKLLRTSSPCYGPPIL